MKSPGHPLIVILVLLLITSCHAKHQEVLYENDPDYNKDTPSLILSRGFDYEEHNIVTDDGYILRTFRIIGDEPEKTRMAVLLVHGLICSSRDFLIADPYGHIDEDKKVIGNNIGFELAKRGYDVWLLNARGNTYSQNHTKYPTNEVINPHPQFWDFSHEGIARYDVPAAVDYVLHVTGRKTVAWVGHSRGTMTMFGALSIYPRLNQLLKPVIALSPIATVKHATSVSNMFFQFSEFLTAIAPPLNYRGAQMSFLPEWVKLKLCSAGDGLLMGFAFKVFTGDSPGVFNLTRMPIICSRLPAGTSTKDFRLFAQNAITGRFTYYDYGPIVNMVKYGSMMAPEFELNKITNREIHLIKGDSDDYSSAADTNKIRRILGHRIREDIIVKYPGWGHMAMLFGQQLGKYVIPDILRILDKYD